MYKAYWPFRSLLLSAPELGTLLLLVMEAYVYWIIWIIVSSVENGWNP